MCARDHLPRDTDLYLTHDMAIEERTAHVAKHRRIVPAPHRTGSDYEPLDEFDGPLLAFASSHAQSEPRSPLLGLAALGFYWASTAGGVVWLLMR